MTAIRRSITALLFILTFALAACSPGAGATQSPAGAGTPVNAYPAAPSLAPGSYGY